MNQNVLSLKDENIIREFMPCLFFLFKVLMDCKCFDIIYYYFLTLVLFSNIFFNIKFKNFNSHVKLKCE